jgi:prepilin-type N-terminal cleavage/methylation domain-containing protein
MNSGYTLVELVIVISITAVLAASLGPRFFSQSVFSQRGYADELASALRFTQKAAVISGCPAELTVTSTAYVANQQAVSGNTCNTADTSWSTPILGAAGDAIQNNAPSGTTVSPTGVFAFDDQGRLTSSPGTTITIGSRTITIVAGTGFVQVQ